MGSGEGFQNVEFGTEDVEFNVPLGHLDGNVW